jgi:hypothetical protein
MISPIRENGCVRSISNSFEVGYCFGYRKLPVYYTGEMRKIITVRIRKDEKSKSSSNACVARAVKKVSSDYI